MLTRIVLLLCLGFGGWQSSFAGVVRIADGDCAGLSDAVHVAAQNSSSTTILLARNGTYAGCQVRMNLTLTENGGNVLMDGQGAQMQFFSACIEGAHNLPGAMKPSLTLRNMAIGPATGVLQLCGTGAVGPMAGFPTFGAIANGGVLNLENVSLKGLNLPASSAPFYTGFILNTGELVLRNVTIVDIDEQTSEFGEFIGALLTNRGDMEIYNSTFARNKQADFESAGLQLTPLIIGSATVANSVFAKNVSSVCSSGTSFKSLGGNVTDDTSCGFSNNTGDKIVVNARLGTYDNHGGQIPTQALNYDSPARGAGVAQYCEALDARGYTRSPHGCDAGAYEYGGGSGALTENGMNGFYYDPDANGHYVSIQRIHDNGDVAIVWSAFDANGNQAWVYGVGHVSGKHIHADMSQNIGGILQAGGPPRGSSVRTWGTVDIDLTSCALAQFNYASTIDGFGSGQFPLTRLAFVSDFGCAE